MNPVRKNAAGTMMISDPMLILRTPPASSRGFTIHNGRGAPAVNGVLRIKIAFMASAVITSAVRLPTGKFLGGLKGFVAPELGAMVIREAVRRAGIDPAIVQECIMGNVV